MHLEHNYNLVYMQHETYTLFQNVSGCLQFDAFFIRLVYVFYTRGMRKS